MGCIGGAVPRTWQTSRKMKVERGVCLASGDYFGAAEELGLKTIVRPVSGCRRIGKKDMLHNYALPNIDVDAETYEVRVDGKIITCEPATVLPLAQQYFFF